MIIVTEKRGQLFRGKKVKAKDKQQESQEPHRTRFEGSLH
jgi:hypothetical protein